VVCGDVSGRPIVVFDGRPHQYEGHSAAAAAFPARVAGALGVDALLIVSAAGGIRPTLVPGDLMVVDDLINLSFRNPLVGPAHPGDERFPDMSAPFDPELTDHLVASIEATGRIPARGVYAGVLGPGYETPAEIRMLAAFGADAVGMSTIPEVLAARALGLRVAALTVITNLASGVLDSAAPRQLTHDEVLQRARAASARVAQALTGFSRAAA
jgi:purine-nucleoside phosphorylase